jgi:hypothetical protein
MNKAVAATIGSVPGRAHISLTEPAGRKWPTLEGNKVRESRLEPAYRQKPNVDTAERDRGRTSRNRKISHVV